MFHHLVEDMKVVVMMTGGMVVPKMIVVVMMVDGGVEMTDQGTIIVGSEGKMKIVDGVVMTKGNPPQEEINLRKKWMMKDLKSSVLDVEQLFSYCNCLVC